MNSSEQSWSQVDAYLDEVVTRQDAALHVVLQSSADADLPQIAVSPGQGKLLHILARSIRASRVLEIGTLGGYSTVWLARALSPGGQLITLELDPDRAAVAQQNVVASGVADRVRIMIGPALDTLTQLEDAGDTGFDLVFIDADKENNPRYVQWAIRHTRRGGLIVLDNIVRDGQIIDADSSDPRVIGTREALAILGSDPRLVATAIQTVGSKGWDGLAIAHVL